MAENKIKAWAVVSEDPNYKIPITKSRVETGVDYKMDLFSIFRTKQLAVNAIKMAKKEDPNIEKVKAVKIEITIKQ